MSDGRVFVDPNLIYPGWILLMPGNDPAATQPTDAPAPSPLPRLAPYHPRSNLYLGPSRALRNKIGPPVRDFSPQPDAPNDLLCPYTR